MSEGFSLLLVLVVVYLYDCVIFLHRQAAALTRPWRTWRVRLASGPFGNATGALLGLQPLPPLGMLHETAPWPLSIAEDGVCAFAGASFSGSDRPPQTGKVLLYHEINDVKSSGHDILVNGTVFATTPSAALAAHLAALVTATASAPRECRMKLVGDAIDASLDVKSAMGTSTELDSRTLGLRVACNVLWVYIYLVCPLATFFLGLAWLIIPLAIAGLMIHVPTVAWFVRLHRRLYPNERGTRFEQTFKMSLCPPMAIRAVDDLTRYGIALYHPVAAAVALCPSQDAARFGGLLVRDLRYPLPIPLEKQGTQIEASFRALFSHRLEAMLRTNGIAPQTGPEPGHAQADGRTFCPRCLNVFTVENGTCQDCFNLKLEPLPAQPPGIKETS
jgi:hypothetical protein